MPRLPIAIHGAAGRMGRRLVALASADPELAIVAALESPDHPLFGKDAGLTAGVEQLSVNIGAEIPSHVEAMIDFSLPDASEAIVAQCRQRNIPVVVATTGLSDQQLADVRQAAKSIAIVSAPSMSLAVNLTMKLAETAGAALKNHPSGVDVEILERHHRFKEDAPSGTALRFGEIIAGVMGKEKHTHGRHGVTGQRSSEEIGYHAIRTGDNPGEHTIVFGLLGETIELTVRATNRDCYAHGALLAAKFVARQKPGLYNMMDVLEI